MLTMATKVSVIVPCHNASQYIARTLNSIVKQTLKEIEILCINDASTDDTLCILEKYRLSDHRIKIIDFKENRGVSVARNEGIKKACGIYIYLSWIVTMR
jgi:glycosyltransferase involved in cell wall biosynthesis